MSAVATTRFNAPLRIAKKLVDWAIQLVFSRQTTRQAPAGVSGNPPTVQATMPVVAGMPFATFVAQVLPPSTETSTFTVWFENALPASHRRVTSPS